jgi:hypothetical protein
LAQNQRKFSLMAQARAVFSLLSASCVRNFCRIFLGGDEVLIA